MALVELDQSYFGNDLNSDATSWEEEVRQAFSSIKEGTCLGSEQLGWYHYPARHGFSQAEAIKSVVESIRGDYDLVVAVGVGGSYLGTRAVAEALCHRFLSQVPAQLGQRRIPIAYAGHHLDETSYLELFDLLSAHNPIVVMISKSGLTTEPSVAFRLLRHYLMDRYGESHGRERLIVVTDSEKGVLRELAQQQGLSSFAIPADIGGRFSVTTAAGLVPLALAGFDIEALLEGAESMFHEIDDSYHRSRSHIHPALAYAACRAAAYHQGKRIELLAYSQPKLRYFVEWWKQLFGESEGKQGKGLFPSGMSYTTDLHSLGQMVQSGERNLFETFLSFRSEHPKGPLERRLRVPQLADNLDQLQYLEGRYLSDLNHAAEEGTKMAHFDGGVPCLEICASTLDERGLGALFSFFEVACAVSGLSLGLNPFDQPGVEYYKTNLFGLLGRPGYEDLGQHLRQRIQHMGPDIS